MTIAISIKVNDGLVMAADSASTIVSAESIVNVYDNTNKVFNLHKQLPVGAITWGSGSIGNSSIATLVKDFRQLITNDPSYRINPQEYTIKEIVEKFYDFIILNNYTREFAGWENKPDLGFIIGGYSAGATHAEDWIIQINENQIHPPELLRDLVESGLVWQGQPEAIYRLVLGYSPLLENILLHAKIEEEKVKEILGLCEAHLQAPMIIPAMPIQDVIDIARFLVDLTAKYIKYTPGAPTVGGPIEIAAITKHEGFKWVQRKFYFDKKYNPGGET